MSYATKEQLEALAAYMASKISVPTIGIGGGYAPIGTIISYMGTTAPADYLACDGSVVNIADYPQLATFFETQFGSKNYFGGDGTTTFAVPDLRGEFLRGTGTNGHTDQGDGASVGTHQDATWHTRSMSGSVVGMNGAGVITTVNDDYTKTSVTRLIVPPSSNDTAGTVFASRPTNTSVLYCIKYREQNTYSTDEQRVGTWIDGKPLYQKTWTGTTGTSTSSDLFTITGADKIIRSEGYVDDGNGYFFNLNYCQGVDNFYSIFTKDGVVKFRKQAGNNYSYAITVQYTKTTD